MEESLVSLKAKPNFISTFNQVNPLHKQKYSAIDKE